MKSWKVLKKELLQNKAVAKEYKRLEPRYKLISALIDARLKRGLTQQQLAKKMKTKQSAVARIESLGGNPTISSIEKIATALNTRLEIRLTSL
jgi:ribosome-binding protein aMBF1 (putative translation factor)